MMFTGCVCDMVSLVVFETNKKDLRRVVSKTKYVYVIICVFIQKNVFV